jgi:hypothetical protein
MKLLKAWAAFTSVVLAAANSPAPIDSRSLSEIYADAQKVSGTLQVAYGEMVHISLNE